MDDDMVLLCVCL